ncbi:hypothetical protein Tco_0711669 [Tanacetum coccineum]
MSANWSILFLLHPAYQVYHQGNCIPPEVAFPSIKAFPAGSASENAINSKPESFEIPVSHDYGNFRHGVSCQEFLASVRFRTVIPLSSLKIALNLREKVLEILLVFLMDRRNRSSVLNSHQQITRIYFFPFMLATRIGPHKSCEAKFSLPLELGTAFVLNELLLLSILSQENKVDVIEFQMRNSFDAITCLSWEALAMIQIGVDDVVSLRDIV